MAVQPPPAAPAPPPTQPAVPPASPRGSGCFGRGCGFSCAGCLVLIVLVALAAGGGGYWFFVLQASAAVNAPAAVIVFNQPVTVDGHPAIPGESLNPGDTVATQDHGHAAIQFPDGSSIRLSPNTTVTVTAAELRRDGRLQSASVVQKVGRTFTNVQHLAGGASFEVGGHSVTAEVRGTQFEVLVRSDGTNRIWVFVGTVTVAGKTTVRLTAGDEIDGAADGTLSNLRRNQFDSQDAFPLAAQCDGALGAGTTPGTMQTSTGDPLTTGQTAETDYDSPGGTLTVGLCYPGSSLTVTVVDPSGATHTSRQSGSPVVLTLDGPPGLYRATVRAAAVTTPEAYAVVFATNAPCQAGNVDTGTTVRETLSNSQISTALAEAGSSGVTLQVAGTSPTSARLFYYSDIGGVPLSWTIVFYAATPNLGAVITQVTVRGINVTTQVISRLSSFGGNSISSIPSGFVVDRVYSCTSPTGDDLMVIEGHR